MIKVVVNPDEDFAKSIKKKIKKNNGHCACAIAFNPDNKCMCKEFREQIEQGKLGGCDCGLYIVVDE